MTKSKIRVLCVDDHRLLLEGLTLIISRYSDMKVVGAAVTGDEAVTLFRRHSPDITLMDLQLPVMSGTEAIHIIRRLKPNAKIIVLTTYHRDEDIYQAIQAGATTYLLKDMIASELITTIREVHEGTHSLRPDLQFTLDKRAARPALTPREIEITSLIAKGLRNKEIGATLKISEETVQSHVKNILQKLEAQDRTAAVNVALQRGIIHLAL